MTKILLDAKTRRMWAARASDASSLLSDVIELITIARTKTKWIGSNKKQITALKKIHDNVMSCAIKHFSVENTCVTATFGAYFRARVNKDLITITIQDERAMASVVSHVCDAEHLYHYLDSFTKRDTLSPKEAHIELLTSLLLDEETKAFLLKENGDNDKYFKPIQLLIMSVFEILDFINTPFTVLAAEAGAHKESTSAVDLQWGSMQKALLEAMQTIIDLKQDMTEDKKRDKKQDKKNKKPTANNCPPRMTEILQQTKDRLIILSGSFGMENTIFTQHQHAETAAIRHEQLINYFIPMFTPAGQVQEAYDPTKDYRPALHAYGDGWLKANERLQLELKTANLAKEQALDELKALQEQLTSAQAEADRIREISQQISRENQELKHKLHPTSAPAHTQFDESFYDTSTDRENVTPSSSRQNESDQLLEPELTDKELRDKQKFLTELDEQINRIAKKKLGKGDNSQQDKVTRLDELKKSVNATFNTKSLNAVITEFNETNYAVISAQRRTQGFWSLFNPKQPKSQQLLDKYCPRP